MDLWHDAAYIIFSNSYQIINKKHVELQITLSINSILLLKIYHKIQIPDVLRQNCRKIKHNQMTKFDKELQLVET